MDTPINRREAIKRATLLVGIALSSSEVSHCLAVTDSVNSSNVPWSPQFISNDLYLELVAIVELIFPRTDTLGAIDAKVPQYVDLFYGQYLNNAERDLLYQGLKKLSLGVFSKSTRDEQANQMTALAQSAIKEDRGFLSILRHLTITGYFTSESVMKTVTKYDPIPGTYVPCVPISKTGNTIMSESR